ncbi:hypothetical protein DAPPUDRAFT_329447 [Daphnia pulex]|uniref:Uncharacterized protein n=1 Tax=Daphnia pulex TaxID=6669 RepID=E9HGM2_DAPPU|nr:hypothetical protein DAPPUDRAFT_329447 [Daphnia pulex]|eukprot:EFX69110.1 hypothetical protein DAPPUDRAFT_329447 [Daphnia pulex]
MADAVPARGHGGFGHRGHGGRANATYAAIAIANTYATSHLICYLWAGTVGGGVHQLSLS